MIKRSLDFTLSLAALMFLLPVILVIMMIIKVSDPGPVFYRGVRVGQHGKSFRMIKFRTMVVDADKRGGPSTPDSDPRITRLGMFLRKTKLDEIPQLVNVLMGQMSLVGPRPEVREYVQMYTDQEKRILRVKPGITDWASLWNFDEGALLAGSPDPEKTYLEKIRPEKIRLQLKYVDHRSVLIDLQIILETLLKVLKQAFKR